LEGAKGYSITVTSPEKPMRGPAYLLESKVGVSPFDGSLRVAGTLELGSSGLDLNTNRLASIESAAKESLRGWDPQAPQEMWAGYRPVLPDGLPAIGQVPGKDGLFVAAGHSMLGITLAPTTAALLAPAILEGQPSLELAPFSLARFANPN
jgi:D-amino-acid dehydrogenase